MGAGRKAGLLLALSVLACATAQARTTGAAFLKIDTGARPAAMGGAYTAIADDINALYYNPGGLALITKRELGATHAEWVLGSKFDFVGFGQPTSVGTFGVGLTRLATGRQEARSASGQPEGGIEAADTAYTLGYGRSLGDILPTGRTDFGVNAKRLESSIGSDKASTFAFDLGVVHKLGGRPLSLGFSVLNIGRGMRFLDQTDPLPLTISAGGAYRLVGAFNLALDVRHEPNARTTDVGIGTEYAILTGFMLRAGYASLAPQGAGGSPLSGLGGGFGLRMGNYRADYTFTPFGALGNAQRISLGVRW
jgi:hypothetical protein